MICVRSFHLYNWSETYSAASKSSCKYFLRKWQYGREEVFQLGFGFLVCALFLFFLIYNFLCMRWVLACVGSLLPLNIRSILCIVKIDSYSISLVLYNFLVMLQNLHSCFIISLVSLNSSLELFSWNTTSARSTTLFRLQFQTSLAILIMILWILFKSSYTLAHG